MSTPTHTVSAQEAQAHAVAAQLVARGFTAVVTYVDVGYLHPGYYEVRTNAPIALRHALERAREGRALSAADVTLLAQYPEHTPEGAKAGGL